MTVWIRTQPRSKLDELTTPWHLRYEGPTMVAVEHLTFGACGSNLGEHVETLAEDPDAGDRCPSCAGQAAREA